MQVVQPELEGDRGAFLAHRLVGLFLDLLDDFLDPRRVDAAVGDQPLDRLLRDLAAVGIEAGEDDRARRVVDDQVDAGGELERADVAPFAADDAALEIVARQVDDRDGRLDGVLRAAALDRLGDVLLGAVDRRFARLGVEPLQEVRRVVARFALDLPDQQLFRLVGGQAGDAFELVLAAARRAARTLSRRPPRSPSRARPARGRGRSSSFSSRSIADLPLGRRGLAPRQRLLERRRLLALLARLALGLHQDVVRLLLGLEQRFLLAGFGVALGVPDDAQRPVLRRGRWFRRRCACGWRPRRRTSRRRPRRSRRRVR